MTAWFRPPQSAETRKRPPCRSSGSLSRLAHYSLDPTALVHHGTWVYRWVSLQRCTRWARLRFGFRRAARRNRRTCDSACSSPDYALRSAAMSHIGLDPLWWTHSERRIRCPQWQTRRAQRTRRSFTEEYKTGAVRLVLDEGKTVAAVARDLDLTESSLRNWVEHARADRTKGKTGLTTAEREELVRLRKELRIVQEERDILKKAAAFFAKQSR